MTNFEVLRNVFDISFESLLDIFSKLRVNVMLIKIWYPNTVKVLFSLCLNLIYIVFLLMSFKKLRTPFFPLPFLSNWCCEQAVSTITLSFLIYNFSLKKSWVCLKGNIYQESWLSVSALQTSHFQQVAPTGCT